MKRILALFLALASALALAACGAQNAGGTTQNTQSINPSQSMQNTSSTTTNTTTNTTASSDISPDVYGEGSQGLKYEINSDRKTCTITGKGKCRDKAVKIPLEIDGYTVTAIGDNAFSSVYSITSVIIPPTVKTIEKEGCLESPDELP